MPESLETAQKEIQEAGMRGFSAPGRLPPDIWFARVISALRLPFWAGICAVGLVPAIALWSLGIGIRIATDFTGIPVISLPLLVLNVVYLLGSSQLIRSRVLRLSDYTRTLWTGFGTGGLSRLSSLAAIACVWVVLLLASSLFFDTFVFNLHYSLYQTLLRIVVTSYLRFVQATFLWVLGYSMYSIYRWGRLPMKLRSFTEDRTLGLNPYGTASLLFVTLYIAAVVLTFPVFVYEGWGVIVGQTVFFLLGLLIFLWPLLGLRKKLVETKRQKLDWIGTRYRRVMDLVESSGEDGSLDVGVVNELIAIDHIRHDLQEIRHWPFDYGIMAKLATVVIVPVLTVLLATYLIHMLHL